jgi:quercetin dioxygenase-like cupin family protein
MASSYGDVTEFKFDPDEFADELARAAENFAVGTRLLHEDDRIRVWDITLAPGERLPFHRHRTSYFYRCESGGTVLLRHPDGAEEVYESPADEVHFHDIGPDDLVVHELENVGETTVRYTTVELLVGR